MAEGFRVREIINRPVDAVWEYITDIHRADEWMRGVKDVQAVNNDPPGIGLCFKFTARGKQYDAEIVAYEPHYLFALSSTQGNISAVYTYILYKRDRHTEIELKAVCSTKGFAKIFQPIIAFLMKRHDSGQLITLKMLLES